MRAREPDRILEGRCFSRSGVRDSVAKETQVLVLRMGALAIPGLRAWL